MMAPPVLSQASNRDWVSNALFVVCCLLLLLPLWTTEFLPMVDLPQYAGMLSVLNRFGDPQFDYSEVFALDFFTPYLLGHGLGWVLSLLMPVKLVVRLLISLAVLGVPVATRMLNRDFGGRPEWDFLGFPIAVSYAFGWGTVNFVYGIPLAIWFIRRAIRYSAEPTRRSGLLLAAIAIGLFWLHFLIMAFSCAVGASVVAARSPGIRQAILRSLPFVSPLPFLGLWISQTQATEAQVSGTILGWSVDRFLTLPAHLVGSAAGGLDEPQVTIHLIGGLCLLALVLMTGAVPSRRVWRWIPFVFALSLYLLTPYWIFGTGLLYARFAVFLIPFLLIAVEPSQGRLASSRALRLLPVAFAISWLVYSAVMFRSFDQQNADFRKVLDRADENKVMLSLIFDRESDYFAGPQYLHFPLWYQVEKGGYVEFSFAMFYQEIVRFRSQVGRVPIGYEWDPYAFNWVQYGAQRFDLFLVRAPFDIGPMLFAGRPVKLAASSGDWWLYKRVGSGLGQ